MRKNPHAVALGRKGGKAKSERKAASSRENGKKGGRPRTFLSIDVYLTSEPVDFASAQLKDVCAKSHKRSAYDWHYDGTRLVVTLFQPLYVSRLIFVYFDKPVLWLRVDRTMAVDETLSAEVTAA